MKIVLKIHILNNFEIYMHYIFATTKKLRAFQAVLNIIYNKHMHLLIYISIIF